MDNATKPTPMELLKAVSPAGAKTCMDHRAAAWEKRPHRS